jgi:hypothetical protein
MNTTIIMKQKHTALYAIALLALLLSLASCSLTREDIGPYQGDTQIYSLANFDRLDMGSAFTITVQQGPVFSITAEGDRRNLDDLDVYTRNGTLYARYRTSRRREYETAFTITMPTLRGVAFSGASRSTVTGFSNLSDLDIDLSGASTGKFTVQATRMNLNLSGASNLQLNGTGNSLSAVVTGASLLQAFTYPVSEADLEASGASKVNVSVAAKLTANASGASSIRYRGTPVVQQHVSGASTIDRE